ncbi:hypothetical protein HZS_460 [Henneguya salminicola]|nr:hypothetical protein HZS_460 [Henneguya salminicola]
MISFSDVKRYINDTPAVMKFKPWWEISLDLLLAGLFLIMILAWTRSYTVEAGGLVCIPLNGDASSFSTTDARYTQSRCYMESSVSTIEFYPYILLMQWCVMFLCQISWIWIPSVTAKFLYFYNIFNEIVTIDPTFVFNPNNCGMLPELDYNDENRAKLKVIHDKITFVLMDKNYLSIIYRRKSYILTFIVFICALILVLWLSFVEFLNSNFTCKLDGGEAKKAMPLAVCNVSPHMFVYGIMILHVLILSLMLLFSIKSIIWHRQMNRRFRNSSDKLFGEFAADYKGLPGYEDLALILELVKVNVRDGHFILTAVIYVLTTKYDRRKPVFTKKNEAIVMENKKKVTYSFWEEFCIVSLMASELGLVICNYEQKSDTLFDYLNCLYKNQHQQNFNININIRDEIYNEIANNIAYYSYIAESDTNFPPIQPNSQIIESYTVWNKIKGVKLEEDWPDHLILMAASNLLKIKIILISADPPQNEDLFSHDVFKPFHIENCQSTIILVYIFPYYYYAVENQKNSDISQQTNKLDYMKQRRYRDRLRQNAIRKVSMEASNLHGHNKTRNIRAERSKQHKLIRDKTKPFLKSYHESLQLGGKTKNQHLEINPKDTVLSSKINISKTKSISQDSLITSTHGHKTQEE